MNHENESAYRQKLTLFSFNDFLLVFRFLKYKIHMVHENEIIYKKKLKEKNSTKITLEKNEIKVKE